MHSLHLPLLCSTSNIFHLVSVMVIQWKALVEGWQWEHMSQAISVYLGGSASISSTVPAFIAQPLLWLWFSLGSLLSGHGNNCSSLGFWGWQYLSTLAHLSFILSSSVSFLALPSSLYLLPWIKFPLVNYLPWILFSWLCLYWFCMLVFDFGGSV